MKKPDYSAKAKHILITGRSATGKTSIAQSIIEDSKNELVLIFDPEHEFAGRFGVEPIFTFDDVDKARAKNRIVCFDPERYEVLPEGFEDFCRFNWETAQIFHSPDGKKNYSILMVVDELQDYVDHDRVPVSFRPCIQKGRRYHLEMVCISQQPNLLHNIIRTQTTEVIVFAQTDILATKFNSRLGVPMEEILALPDLHFLRKVGNSPVEKGEISFDKRGWITVTIKGNDKDSPQPAGNVTG